MAWGQPKTRNKPYEADYNRAYDTHTPGATSREFAVNNPTSADRPQENTPPHRAYKNPLAGVDATGAEPDAVWQREMQTGNAPSGGYTERPYLGFASRIGGESIGNVTIGDTRRLGEYKPNDWESGQVGIHVMRDHDRVLRREEVGQEQNESSGANAVARIAESPVTAVEDSPYRWGNPTPNRPTMSVNPNTWRFWRDWDRAGDYRGSGARYLNGMHYSMAQHNSLDPYGPSTDGAAPVRQFRNTFRLDPQPWDAGNTDSPQNTPGYVTTTSTAVDLQSETSRAYRL